MLKMADKRGSEVLSEPLAQTKHLRELLKSPDVRWDGLSH